MQEDNVVAGMLEVRTEMAMELSVAKTHYVLHAKAIREIARECPQLKHPRDFQYYFKTRLLLMECHENGWLVLLDAEQLLFLAVEDDCIDCQVLMKCYEQGVQSRSANKQVKVVNDTLTSKLARYKELVRVYEQRAKFELTDRE
ncbi:hypothetical protein Tco_1300563 [Tanacetum coccineum]